MPAARRRLPSSTSRLEPDGGSLVVAGERERILVRHRPAGRLPCGPGPDLDPKGAVHSARAKDWTSVGAETCEGRHGRDVAARADVVFSGSSPSTQPSQRRMTT